MTKMDDERTARVIPKCAASRLPLTEREGDVRGNKKSDNNLSREIYSRS
jgi:hypothetical protein